MIDLLESSADRANLASARVLGVDEGPAEIILALASITAAEALARLVSLTARMAPGGVLVLALAGGMDEGLQAALGAQFRSVAAFVQRPVLGSLIASIQFAGSCVTALADAAPAGDTECCVILACGDTLPALATGLFEMARPALEPLPRVAPPEVARTKLADTPADITRADGVALVERLMELDQRAFLLQAENWALRDRTAPVSGPVAPDCARAADSPAAEIFSWPLAENPELTPGDLGLYERRPDDDVVAVARAGDAFFAGYGLLGDRPDFAGAVAGLNALGALPASVGEPDAPEISIVIPVFGQLAYTLNCLDGLLRHASRHRAEIIVVDDCSSDETGAVLSEVTAIRLHRLPRNGGFIAACNAGGELARGRFIVLLNNDTRPLPGWLDGLVESFSLFPAAGLVGSKLLYPDFTLQEAGGIVWRDGHAWNYGRGDDPNRPCYCHARQADYISGASIALPAWLWRDLGGLDRDYAPAYYEDTDAAFRVRASGREVWFQPASRVIHYEGRTSGTDMASGAKSYQAINHGKFLYRWREQLLRHGSNRATVMTESQRQVTKRALLLDDTAPTPKRDAGSNYSMLTMRLFQALGYQLSYVPQDNFLYQPEYIGLLQRRGIDCAYLPYELGTDSYFQRHGDLFDVVMVSRIAVLERVIDGLREFAARAPILFNTHDLNFLRMRRTAELAGNPAMLVAAEAARERELGLMRQVDCIITPSAFEADILARELPEVPRCVLPIMADREGTKVGFERRRDVCFLGGYRHPPNIDAVGYFVREIFPLLKRAEPGLRFIVAGADPTPGLQALSSADIVVTGMVDDLRDVFDRARVFVCPLRVGAGAKGKVASAMSYGVPVVSTSIGAEGMGLVDGETVLIADDPAAFAETCLRLYRERPLWERMSAASLELVGRVASPEARERVFGAAIDAAFRHKCGVG